MDFYSTECVTHCKPVFKYFGNIKHKMVGNDKPILGLNSAKFPLFSQLLAEYDRQILIKQLDYTMRVNLHNSTVL